MAFPTTSVITNFTVADEAPLSVGGIFSGPIRATINVPRVVSNQAAAASSGGGTSETYYNPSTYTESEVFATIATLPSTSGDFIELCARIQSPNSAGADFYCLEYVWNSGAANDAWDCYRVINTTFTSIGPFVAAGSSDIAAGDKLGFTVEGTGGTVTLKAYRFTGGSWSLIGTVTDTNAARIVAAGYIGFELNRNNSPTRLDDFGGGEVAGGGTLTKAGYAKAAATSGGVSVNTDTETGVGKIGAVASGASVKAGGSTTFPTTAVLTNFTTADENPIDEAGAWSGPMRVGRGLPKIASNRAAGTGAGSTDEAYWDATVYGETEVYATIPALPTVDGQFVSVDARILNPGTSTVTFYQCSYIFRTGTDEVYISRLNTNGTWTDISVPHATVNFVAGDKIGMSVEGSGGTVTIKIFRFTSGAWAQLGSTLTDTSASRITSPGYIGIDMTSNVNNVLDGFGGGTIVGVGSGTTYTKTGKAVIGQVV